MENQNPQEVVPESSGPLGQDNLNTSPESGSGQGPGKVPGSNLKWYIFGILALLAVGFAIYFLAGPGLFKGQIKLQEEEIAQLGECITGIPANEEGNERVGGFYDNKFYPLEVQEGCEVDVATADMDTAKIVYSRITTAGNAETASDGLTWKFAAEDNLGEYELQDLETWDYGDEKKDSDIDYGSTPTHTFDKPGTYTVKVTKYVEGITDYDGQITASKEITVEGLKAVADCKSGSAPWEVSCRGGGSISGAGDIKYSWNFGEVEDWEVDSEEKDASYQYGNGTTSANILLTATSGKYTSRAYQTITFDESGKIVGEGSGETGGNDGGGGDGGDGDAGGPFTVNADCIKDPTETDQYKINCGISSIEPAADGSFEYSFSWDFGDNTDPVTTQSAMHTFDPANITLPATKTVVLTVKGKGEETVKVSKTLNWEENSGPANLDDKITCEQLSIAPNFYTIRCSVPSDDLGIAGVTKKSWSAEDISSPGTKICEQEGNNFECNTDKSGAYKVTLNASSDDDTNVLATGTKEITMVQHEDDVLGTVSATLSPELVGYSSAIFQYALTGTPDGTDTFLWNFGDGQEISYFYSDHTSTESANYAPGQYLHNYLEATGNFTYSLSINKADGSLRDKYTGTVTITNPPLDDGGTEPAPAGDTGAVSLFSDLLTDTFQLFTEEAPATNLLNGDDSPAIRVSYGDGLGIATGSIAETEENIVKIRFNNKQWNLDVNKGGSGGSGDGGRGDEDTGDDDSDEGGDDSDDDTDDDDTDDDDDSDTNNSTETIVSAPAAGGVAGGSRRGDDGFIRDKGPKTPEVETETPDEEGDDGTVARFTEEETPEIVTGDISIDDVLELEQFECLNAAIDPADFSDVDSDDDTINLLAAISYGGKAVFQGTTENGVTTFNTNAYINRAEILKALMVASCTPYNLPVAGEVFKDVPSDAWHRPFVASAKEQDIVKGYEDNTYRPGQQVSRMEAIKMLAEISGIDEADESCEEQPFIDIDENHWGFEIARNAFCSNVYVGKTIGKGRYLFPDEPLTRGEMAVLIYNYYVSEIENSI